jgi:hypothetical protein
LSAKLGKPKCLNIITDDTRIADGLTIFYPIIIYIINRIPAMSCPACLNP